jgi:c-di-GMP-related signal transduction protein
MSRFTASTLLQYVDPSSVGLADEDVSAGVAEPFEQSAHPHDNIEFRRFALQPIVAANERRFGSEALFRMGREDVFTGDPDLASVIMLDNCLLYGLEEVIGGGAVFLNCTRETLMSGLLSLLPRSAVLEVLEWVEPDEEVLAVCRELKAAGYRIALDDFKSLENMEMFLDLADFIKVDFRHSGRRERACMLHGLKLTRAALIAEKIESEEEFQQAIEEGFTLFQGFWVAERMNHARESVPLDVIQCARILEALEDPGFDVNELAELVSLESGIECRLLRRANWASPAGEVIDLTRDALNVAGKADLEKIVTLAMAATPDEDARSGFEGLGTLVS